MKRLITIIGSGTGISHSVAYRFGKEGFSVALISRTENNLKKEVEQLQNKGIDACYAVADVANPISLNEALGKIEDKAGFSDVFVYNAAAFSMKKPMDESWVSIKNDLDTTVGGFFHLMKIVLPQYLAKNKGKILVTGGGFALQANPDFTALSLGKAALRNLVQNFQKDLENTEIHIALLTICGFVNPEDMKYNPLAIADKYWELYNQSPSKKELEIIY